MAPPSPTPHDALFKGLIGKLEHARCLLRWLVPAAVADAINWQSLTLAPGNFVDPDLGQQYTDLLFSARWLQERALPAYFLFEHQSAPPKTRDGPMVYRLLRYQVRIWEQWHGQNPEARSLPMIVPLVLYHGLAPWPERRALADVIAVPPGVRPMGDRDTSRLDYLLCDLSEISEEELRERELTALVRLVILCFQHARTHPDFLALLKRWMDVVREVAAAPDGLAALTQVLCYVLQVSESVERESLRALLAHEIGPKTEEVIMTAGQLLIEQGIEQGIKKGHQQGVRAMLLKQLRQRFGSQVDTRVEQRLAAASTEQLEGWAERLLAATSLDELLAS